MLTHTRKANWRFARPPTLAKDRTMSPAKPGQPSSRFQVLAGVGFVVVCLGLFAPKLFSSNPPAQAADAPASPLAAAPPAGDTSGLGWTVAKMAIGVGLVAVVCIAVARYVNRKAAPATPSELQVLASLPVDARCVVHLVRVADRRLLVGVDAAGVKAVAELPAGVPLPAPPAQVIGPVAVNATSTPLPADVAALFETLRVRANG
jgi:flagellar biogenesis protein FliO